MTGATGSTAPRSTKAPNPSHDGPVMVLEPTCRRREAIPDPESLPVVNDTLTVRSVWVPSG